MVGKLIAMLFSNIVLMFFDNFICKFVNLAAMSYFSESISHSALLGVSLGLISGLDIHIGLIVVGVLFALKIKSSTISLSQLFLTVLTQPI
jgi:zinc transport system permease protein